MKTNAPEDLITNKLEDRRIVKKLREMYGARQSDVAGDAKISQSKLSLWENEFVDLADKELQRLAKVMNALSEKNYASPGKPGITAVMRGTFAEEYASWSETKRVKARRSLRRQAHLTVIALAEKIGIPEKKLREWENGKKRVELTDAEEKKWQQAITAASVEKMKADPWTRTAFMADTLLNERAELLAERKSFLSRLKSLSSIEDPVIAEIMESFRREISELEQQKKPVASSNDAD